MLHELPILVLVASLLQDAVHAVKPQGSASHEPSSAGPVQPPTGATPPAVTRPAAPADAPPASGKTAEEIERDLMIDRLIAEGEARKGQRNLDLPAIKAIEREVEALRATADGMAGEGERTAEVLAAVRNATDDLEQIGVSGEQADGIRGLADEVEDLRAKLSLLHLRSPSKNAPDAELTSIEAIPPAPAEVPLAAVPDAAVEAAPPALHAARRYPSRAATLLFHMGHNQQLIALVDEVGKDKLDPDALYAYGAALALSENWAQAREVFVGLAQREDRRVLAQAAARQINRIDGATLGVVGTDPLLLERNKR